MWSTWTGCPTSWQVWQMSVKKIEQQGPEKSDSSGESFVQAHWRVSVEMAEQSLLRGCIVSSTN